MDRLVNPYIAGKALDGKAIFFGRNDIIDWVERELYNRTTNSLVLFGQRRIGKTSLLLHLQRILPKDKFLPIYFDLQDQTRYPLGQVLANLAYITAIQVGLKPISSKYFDDKGDFFCSKFLPQFYKAILGKNRRLVFLLDEFDVMNQVIVDKLPETIASKALFPLLRRLLTEDDKLAFVFVIGRRAEDLSLDFQCNLQSFINT